MKGAPWNNLHVRVYTQNDWHKENIYEIMLWSFVGENEIIDESIYPFENYVKNYVIAHLW